MSKTPLEEKRIIKHYFSIDADGALQPNAAFEALYKKVEAKFFEGKNDNSQLPSHARKEAFLLYVGGGLCAGTTTLIKHLQANQSIPPRDDPNTIYIENSPVMAFIPELNRHWPAEMTPETHFKRDMLQYEYGGEEVTIMLQRRLGKEAARRGLTAVFDSHMSHEQQHLDIIDAYNQNKMPTFCYMVFVEPEKYLDRVQRRSNELGRSVMFSTQLQAHQALAELLARMECAKKVVQNEDDPESFMAGHKQDSAPSYATAFDHIIMLHNNKDATEVADPDKRFGYQEFGRTVKRDDGSVWLTISDPEVYKQVRCLANLDSLHINNAENPEVLEKYFASVKGMKAPPLGEVGTNHEPVKGFKSKDDYAPPPFSSGAGNRLLEFTCRFGAASHSRGRN